ncbi:MAG: hypothetical protein KKC68_09255 [Candidatus Thermoplasmatota archaeon]|nr:hypothetical protein [Candidatus Thermoplasmatota archaeon]MBU1941945.1 hypothetical protein [Candidatus Thermoplasmatota archaeon]
MGIPVIDWEQKTLQYDGLTFSITGTDLTKQCVVGENIDQNLHFIYWMDRVEKKIKPTTEGCAIKGLARDNCLLLDTRAYTALSSAILECEEYCGSSADKKPNK